jgi:succinate dehydrogenase/fumarate reductase cytochrome b subunit
MLSIHQIQHLLTKWNIIYDNRPSTLRSSFILWLIRIVFYLIMLASIVLYITTYSKELWLPAFEEFVPSEQYEAMKWLLSGLRGIAAFFFLISSIITWLTGSALRRNEYIEQIEELMDEFKGFSVNQYNNNPNNYNSNA